MSDPQDIDGTDARPFLTVKPLADSLGLEVDKRFKNKPEKYPEVAEAVKAFQGPGNILICWEHHALTDVSRARPRKDERAHLLLRWYFTSEHYL